MVQLSRLLLSRLSVKSGESKLPEFGVFKKKLDELLQDHSQLQSHAYNVSQNELSKLNGNLHKLFDLSQSDGPEIAKALRRFAVDSFARRPNDTGSPEVQIALSTVRMGLLQRHTVSGHHKDHKTKRTFVQVMHERKKMLKYLRRISLERFHTMLDRLGLSATYLERLESPYTFNYKTKKEFKSPANRTIRGGGRNINELQK